jgi:exosortase/archaeosortase family protein
MIPLPMHMVERLTFKLKMFATMFSVWVVDALRAVRLHSYLVVQDGSYIRWEASPSVLEKVKGLSAEMAAQGAGTDAKALESLQKVLDTGMDKIIIGDVCSGLRSLIALLAFGALFAYLSKMTLARRLLLFAAAVPIAVLANMWRIVTLTFIACRFGSHATHGWVHDFTGYGIFAVAFVLFFGFERFLRAFERGAGGEAPPAEAAKPA